MHQLKQIDAVYSKIPCGKILNIQSGMSIPNIYPIDPALIAVITNDIMDNKRPKAMVVRSELKLWMKSSILERNTSPSVLVSPNPLLI